MNCTAIATFENPWAMTFLPDGRMLVTERPGRLRVVSTTGAVSNPIAGVPAVVYSGHGGLLDVALDQNFASNRTIYLSYALAVTQFSPTIGNALSVVRATLDVDAAGNGQLSDVRVIFTQPAQPGDRNYGGRLFPVPGFNSIYLTTGDRETTNPTFLRDDFYRLGKLMAIINDRGSYSATVAARGLRNSYGIAGSADGRTFMTDMGPVGGDEFNEVSNTQYGWPDVSEGNREDGTPYPRHASNPSARPPLLTWTPAISPTGMIQYSGALFADFRNDFLTGALNAQGLVRIRLNGATATEVGRIPLGARIREVEQGPDGSIWVLEDGPTGRLLRLRPAP